MIKIHYLYVTLLAVLSTAIFTSAIPVKDNKPFVVVLDAGHGGHDSGNRGNGYFEKNIALDIILKIGDILNKSPNIKVIYTRKTDVFIPLSKRADIANKAKADLFVSIHCNAHNSNAYGTETFVLGLHANERNFNIAKKENAVILLEDNYEQDYDGFDPNSPESVIGLTLMQEEYLEQSLNLASFVQQNFTKQLKRFDRGVKQAGFLVLHRTFMPSVLIETGFLTNKNEGKYLNSNNGKQQMALSIAKAIKNYQNTVVESYSAVEKPSITMNKEKEQSTEKNTETIKKDSTKASPQIIAKETNKDSIIEFRIQLAAGSSKLDTAPANFKGLDGVYFEESDGVYKYYYGVEKSYDDIKIVKQSAVKKGFSSCFIVAFKNKKKIPLSEAIEF
ncbi:N-acetylmuramoyl-L-alanine amidase family protein [Aquimarina agarilytica]|uniref:N-acetylmuramoyl-L-alanine amidase family protein n=1 Tax=Aquimarina agarilytica TaxID=1087449 RepID=UPI000287E5A4|nr:N-acetylmuramoyl-L-alanine amidase [Aquimarina agarilytica]